MALERVFTRVLRRLPEDDAIALASQKDKVIQLLHKELLAEGLLVVKEGGGASTALASSQRRGVVASPRKDFSVYVETAVLAGSPFFFDQDRHMYIDISICLFEWLGISWCQVIMSLIAKQSIW